MSKNHMDALNIKASRKERLMEAALMLFSESGFHAVAVPAIAKQAGISTGLVYTYFESKEILVNELFWHWKEKLKSYYLTNFPSDESIRGQFEFIWEKLHQYAHDYPRAFQFIEGQLHSSYLTEKCQLLEEEVFEIGRHFVRNGQANGVIVEADPQLLVAYFFGAFVQYFKDTRVGRQLWSVENSKKIRDLCWVAISKRTLLETSS